MRKIVFGGTTLMVLVVSACNPTTPTQPTPSPVTVASAPSSDQLKTQVREWHLEGGDKVEVPLSVDLDLAHADWRADQFKRQVLTESVIKDTKAAMAYKPIPDDEMQQYWSVFLRTMEVTGNYLSTGAYDKATQGFKDADQAFKKIYDRNQAILSGK